MIENFKRKYLPRRKAKYSNYIIAENEYGSYCIPKSSLHRPCPQKLLAGKVHEPDTINFIRNNYKDGIIIHAGAYFGDMLPALPGLVIAFEPNNESLIACQATIVLNKLENIKLYDLALSDESGAIKYLTTHYKKELGGASYINENGNQKVVTQRLDDMIDNKVTIIHLDIEGYEQKALYGAKNILITYKPLLILERNENMDIDWLKYLGYKQIKEFHNNIAFKVL